jgi:UDP-N-acetylmuramate dehydrogenase
MSLSEQIVREAVESFGKDLLLNERLARHSSFRIGGPADLFLTARDVWALKKALLFCEEKLLPLEALGRGTNVLVPDSGLRGMVICVRVNGVLFNGNRVTMGAGMSLQAVVKAVGQAGLAGLEFAVGIPGSVGGAAFMNAGAHGSWFGKIVADIVGIDCEGREVFFRKKDLRFGYRESSLQDFAGIVCEVTLALHEDDPQAIRERMTQFLQVRRATQPIRAQCAGSVFKNPKRESAGRLIELAGCKGMRRGGAVVSRKHANFIVNRGGASYADVKALIEGVREKVWKAHGVELELEIVDFGEKA